MPQATDLKSAMDAIGISNPDIPSDADLSDVVKTTPAEEQKKEIAPITPAPGTPEKTEGQEATDQTTDEQATEAGESEEKTSDEEKKRRTWQSERDKALAETARVKAEADAKKAELEVERQKNQALMNMLAGVNSLRGGQTSTETIKQEPVKSSDREPILWDFIKKDEYDTAEKDDPDSPSGRAYLAWQDARTDYRAEKKYNEQRAREQAEQVRQMTLKQARDFVEAFPEYKNPFTGEPDLPRINVWLENLSKTDWVTLKKALDGANKPNGHAGVTVPPPARENAEAAIGKRANKPATVAGQGSAPPAAKKVPPEVEKLWALYGEGNPQGVYIPPGMTE